MTETRSFLSGKLISRTVADVDPLADVLDLSRVRGALHGNVRACAPWGLDLPASAGASFHAITSGTAWLRVDGDEPLQLMPGDVLLLPTGVRTGCPPARRPLPAVRPRDEGAADDAGGRSPARRRRARRRRSCAPGTTTTTTSPSR